MAQLCLSVITHTSRGGHRHPPEPQPHSPSKSRTIPTPRENIDALFCLITWGPNSSTRYLISRSPLHQHQIIVIIADTHYIFSLILQLVAYLAWSTRRAFRAQIAYQTNQEISRETRRRRRGFALCTLRSFALPAQQLSAHWPLRNSIPKRQTKDKRQKTKDKKTKKKPHPQ